MYLECLYVCLYLCHPHHFPKIFARVAHRSLRCYIRCIHVIRSLFYLNCLIKTATIKMLIFPNKTDKIICLPLCNLHECSFDPQVDALCCVHWAKRLCIDFDFDSRKLNTFLANLAVLPRTPDVILALYDSAKTEKTKISKKIF